jgi:chromate reductase, NAD(P)H dehydrogenase (quinone)
MNMHNSLHVLGIPGSLRRGSLNRALLTAAQELAPPDMTIEIFDLHDIPLFNADVEAQGTPAAVLAFRERLWAADAYIFANPEYNFSVTGVLKNAIDWASRKGPDGAPPINGKPALIVGAGGRSGALRSQLHLREILLHNDLHVLNKSLTIPFAGQYLDADGHLTDPALRDRLAGLLAALRDWTVQLRPPQPELIF